MTDSQKEMIERLAAEQSVAVQAWKKFDSSTFIPDNAQKDSDVLRVKDSPYFFAFARSDEGLWTCTIAPVGEELHACVQVNSWDECLQKVRQWLVDVCRDRAIGDRWADRSNQCLHYWSQAQRQYVAECLQHDGVPLTFSWHSPESNVRLNYDARNDYEFTASQNYGVTPKYRGIYSPASESFEQKWEATTWPQVQQHIRTWTAALARELGLKPTVHPVPAETVGSRQVYIDNLDIHNFACFREAVASFQYPGRPAKFLSKGFLPNINLIVGSNGSGKTSLLKAIAISILGSVLPDSGFRPYFLVRARGDKGGDTAILKSWTVESGGSEIRGQWHAVLNRVGSETSFDHRNSGLALQHSFDAPPDVVERPGYFRGTIHTPEDLRSGESPAYFLCAYGAGRRSEETALYDAASRKQRMSVRYQRVANLLGDAFTLVSFSAWLQRAASGPVDPHWDDAIAILDQLLDGSGVSYARGIVDGEAHFGLSDGLKVPYPVLSDGYRAFLSWIGDLLHHMMQVTPADMPLVDLPGIVLVDEVDLHLHPSWQQTILARLSRTFPKLQFILTSHSPILAGCVPAENILVTERLPGGPSQVLIPERSLYAKEVDEILMSSLFGLSTVLPPEAAEEERSMRARQEDLAREVLRTRNPQAAQAFLEALTARDSD